MIPTQVQPQFEVRRHLNGVLQYHMGTLIFKGAYDQALHYMIDNMREWNQFGLATEDYLMWEIDPGTGDGKHVQPFPEGYTSMRPTSLGSTLSYDAIDAMSSRLRGSQTRGVQEMANELDRMERGNQPATSETESPDDDSDEEQDDDSDESQADDSDESQADE